jgi:hypothetical protein
MGASIRQVVEGTVERLSTERRIFASSASVIATGEGLSGCVLLILLTHRVGHHSAGMCMPRAARQLDSSSWE